MVDVALKLLHEGSDDNGFFLMIEGSRIDHAEHDNDAAAMWMEAVQYNKAWVKVLDFVQNVDSDTLVVSTSDHETGGLGIGNNNIAYNWLPQNLAIVNASVEQMVNLISLGSGDKFNITVQVLKTYTGITNLTTSEIQIIQGASTEWALRTGLGNIIAGRIGLGWTTASHTAVDVHLYGFGKGVEGLGGAMDNTQVGQFVSEVFGLNLREITDDLREFNLTSGILEKRDNVMKEYHA